MLRSLNQEEQIGVQTPFNYTNHELLSCLHNLCSIVTEEILFSSCPTSSNALQWHAMRQEAHEGLVQVQTVAPRSIKAQLRSPGLIASTNCCASIQKSLIVVEWALSFKAIVQSRHKTQMTFPSTNGTVSLNAIDPIAPAASVAPDSRYFLQLCHSVSQEIFLPICAQFVSPPVIHHDRHTIELFPPQLNPNNEV